MAAERADDGNDAGADEDGGGGERRRPRRERAAKPAAIAAAAARARGVEPPAPAPTASTGKPPPPKKRTSGKRKVGLGNRERAPDPRRAPAAAAAPMFAVEQILERRGEGTAIEYLVLWKGYGRDAATWEPAAGLSHIPKVVQAFNDRALLAQGEGLQGEGAFDEIGEAASRDVAEAVAATFAFGDFT